MMNLIERAKYILNEDHTTSPTDLMSWAVWFETADRKVAKTKIGNYLVSTVFLGLDHNYDPEGAPLLFETMVFGDTWKDQYYCERYSTWDEAVAGHEVGVAWLKAKLNIVEGEVAPQLQLEAK